MAEDSEPVGSGGSRGSRPVVPPALLAQWRTAEERLYPMIMVIPENYERVVRLVGETTVELQLTCPDLASLVAEAPRVAERVRRLADHAVVGDGLDVTLIGAAACLIRFREIEAETGREQRIRTIAAALESGATWVVLEQGIPPTTWPPMPSTTIEMHLASGRALAQTITLDASTGAPRYGLAEIRLDPETGQRRSGEASEEEFCDREEWRARIARGRGQIESGH